MTWRVSTRLTILLAVLLAPAESAWADVTVKIHARGDLNGAVLVATSTDGATEVATPSLAHTGEATMVQANRQFDPFILPVPLNVPVSFPNQDDTAHHVYSFSPAGSFELPLYKGDSPAPITFTRPGVVPLGCNIHDWMIGYIYVVDSPWFTQIVDGSGQLEGLPAGEYEVSLWHPALEGHPSPTWQVTVRGDAQTEHLTLDLQVAEVVQPQPPRTRFDEQWEY